MLKRKDSVERLNEPENAMSFPHQPDQAHDTCLQETMLGVINLKKGTL